MCQASAEQLCVLNRVIAAWQPVTRCPHCGSQDVVPALWGYGGPFWRGNGFGAWWCCDCRRLVADGGDG